MFIDNTGNLRNNGDSSPTFKAYPFEYLRRSGSSLELNQQEARNRFLGVSLDDKDGISGGVDQSLVVATAGKFNFDLKPPKSVKIWQLFGVSGTTSASDLFNQKVMVVSGTSFVLGRFAESKTYAQNADVFIETIFTRTDLGPGLMLQESGGFLLFEDGSYDRMELETGTG